MDPQKFCLRWDGFQDNVTSIFDQLRSGGELLDVTLCCEGQRVRAHRMMLSACSPYFRDLLNNTPGQQLVIFLKDTSAADLHAVVEFMYRGSVNVAQSQLGSFIKTAEMLQIRGLSGDDDKPPDPAPATATRPAPEPRAQPQPRNFTPPVKRRRVSDSGDAPLSSNPAPASSWPRPVASPVRRPDTPVLLSSSSNQSAPSPTPAASPGASAAGLAAVGAVAGGVERLQGSGQDERLPLRTSNRQVPPVSARSLSSSSTSLVSTSAVTSGEASAQASAPALAPASSLAPSAAAKAEDDSGNIKVEKIDLSDGEEGPESSLDATLGQLAEYEGGYGGNMANTGHGRLTRMLGMALAKLDSLIATNGTGGPRTSEPGTGGPRTIEPPFPLPLEEGQLDDVLRHLSFPANRREMALYLAELGGGDLRSTVAAIMAGLMQHNMAQKFTMTGKTKCGRSGKMPFKGTVLHCTVREAVKLAKSTKACSLSEIDASITKWLQGSRDRGGERLKRHNRQRNTSNADQENGEASHAVTSEERELTFGEL